MAQSCGHLAGLAAEDFPPQKTAGACQECPVDGTFWVALRECQSCGHVGCCDLPRNCGHRAAVESSSSVAIFVRALRTEKFLNNRGLNFALSA